MFDNKAQKRKQKKLAKLEKDYAVLPGHGEYSSLDVEKKYNPYIAMGTGEDWPRWEAYLVLVLGQCTREYEKLPLVQDKDILDNILYSGVWSSLNGQRKKAEEKT